MRRRDDEYLRIGIVAPVRRSTKRADLAALLAALTAIDRYQIAVFNLPPLYDAGVRYIREGAQPREEWRSAVEVIEHGGGDCEDLATYRAAELQLAGEDARAIAVRSSLGWHIVVRRGDGTIEDPSARLGMLGEG